MRRSRKNILFLIVITASISFQFFPLLGLGEIFTKNPLVNQSNVTKVDYSNLILPSGVDLRQSGSDSLSTNLGSVFDDNLRKFLTNLSSKHQNDVKDVKIIVLFEEDIYPVLREEILNSVFNDFTIITHYDIISGTYLKLNPMELLSNEMVLKEIKDIKKIYKSEVFESPYIIEKSLQISALNDNLYLLRIEGLLRYN